MQYRLPTDSSEQQAFPSAQASSLILDSSQYPGINFPSSQLYSTLQDLQTSYRSLGSSPSSLNLSNSNILLSSTNSSTNTSLASSSHTSNTSSQSPSSSTSSALTQHSVTDHLSLSGVDKKRPYIDQGLYPKAESGDEENDTPKKKERKLQM